MTTIPTKDITLERLLAVFVANGLSARIVEYAPATAHSTRDAVLSVDYPEDGSVLVWPEEHETGKQLSMRSIVFDRKQRDELPEDVLLDAAAYLNQNASCFGALSVQGVVGVTVEYLLPFQNGILEETVLLAAERIASGASLAREEILGALDDQ